MRTASCVLGGTNQKQSRGGGHPRCDTLALHWRGDGWHGWQFAILPPCSPETIWLAQPARMRPLRTTGTMALALLAFCGRVHAQQIAETDWEIVPRTPGQGE